MGEDLAAGAPAPAMLEIGAVRKVYPARGRGGTAFEALRHLDFRVAAGELVCVVGPSGCGKTTLLKCVAGLLTPTSGQVRLGGAPVRGPAPGMAVVFQEYGRSLFPWMTVRQNVELPLKEKRVPKERRARLVDEALHAVGLGGAGSAHPWQLSGGMQQRAALARAIAYEPQVLLMDEPFAAVDAQTRADLEDLLLALWRRLEITVLLVTHDIDEAVYLGQRVVVLSGAPTVVQDDLAVDLPAERDQITTRSDPRFAGLRARVYARIRQAKGLPAPGVEGGGDARGGPSGGGDAGADAGGGPGAGGSAGGDGGAGGDAGAGGPTGAPTGAPGSAAPDSAAPDAGGAAPARPGRSEPAARSAPGSPPPR